MIQVEGLCKYYGGDKQLLVKALDDVSLTLPDRGMVFIVGKSGSGKSTFMNVLGGLDDVTSGRLIMDGVDIATLSVKELDNYRNNYIGIIYQNFNLFPNETVYQNIMTAALISHKDVTEADVDSLCEKLELLERKNKLVKNMSGGQRQRVAIARALIKDPDMILADEPTGNLDSKTATAIFDILKEISKEKLVIVISHDAQSSEKYADRIITLSDGHVVDDKIRSDENVDNVLPLAKGTDIAPDKLNEINETLRDKGIKISLDTEKFKPFTGEVTTEKTSPDFKIGKNKAKAAFVLGLKFFKYTWVSFVVTFIIISSVLGLLTYAQAFTRFDGRETIKGIVSDYNTNSYVLNKAYSEVGSTTKLETDYMVNTTESDKQVFYDGGYTGNIYEVYNTSMVITSWEYSVGHTDSINDTFSNFYSQEGFGVVVCDEGYLKKLFGNDMKILAGSLYGIEDTAKIIVTDYFADSIIEMSKRYLNNEFKSEDENDPYQKIINSSIRGYYVIGAVVYTGYKERYADIMEMFDKAYAEPQKAVDISKIVFNMKEYSAFLNEATSSLNFGYSLNPNYKEAYINTSLETEFSSLRNIVTTDMGEYVSNIPGAGKFWTKDEVNDGELIMNLSIYNALFGTSLTQDDLSDFKEEYVTYSIFSNDKNVLKDTADYSIRLKIVGVDATIKDEGRLGYVSRQTIKDLWEYGIYSYAFAFDNIDCIYDVSETGQGNYFYTNMTILKPLVTVFNAIEVFSGIFEMIAFILIIIAFLVIVSHNLRVVKKNQYRVGVYRGLGYSTSMIVWACVINIIILLLAIFIGTIIISYSFEGLINNILVESFTKYLKITMLDGYTLIKVSMPIILLYIGVIFGVTLLSVIAPLVYVRKLKPNLILNKVE